MSKPVVVTTPASSDIVLPEDHYRILIHGLIIHAHIIGQKEIRVDKKWCDADLILDLVTDGFKVTGGWYKAYEPGFIISWYA